MTHRIVQIVALFTPLVFGAVLHAAGDWEPFFKDSSYDDLYFAFADDAEPEDVFKIRGEDGLVIDGADKPDGYLQTLDEVENFELRFEFRWADEPGDAGVMIDCDSDPYTSIWTHGVEIDLKTKRVGDFWTRGIKLSVKDDQMPDLAEERDRRKNLKDNEKRANKGKDLYAGADTSRPSKGYWNAMRIVSKDDTIEVYLNDELVNEATDVTPSSGYITFMAQGSDIEFRDIEIRDI